ncbi:MAG TPA: FtsX-like permease family protein, partial [Vicinamibacterales bacterium]|nr:FtsX-like permease family protein [Vicinamibacterales bacterium]
FFPDGNVVGRRLKSGGCTTCPWTTVVGVVGTVKYQGLDAHDDGTVYFPFVDVPNGFAMLRTSGDPASLASSLRTAMQELDPSLALAGTWTGEQLIASSLSAPRSLTLLIGVFALAALILAVVGIYGVMAYFVQQHTRDIGIRLALGGDPSAVRRMVVMQGLRFVGGGVVVGLVTAIAASRLVESVLFEVAPRDPWVLTVVPLTLMAVAVVACLVPGRRAARLDPATVLRE